MRKDLSFQKYIRQVLLQIAPDMTLSDTSSKMLNSIAYNLLNILSETTIRVTQLKEDKTISARSVQTAVRLKLVGELAKHAVSQGSKAVTNYTDYNNANKKKRVTTEKKAKLQFKVSRCKTILQRHQSKDTPNIAPTAAIYLAAVVEYVCAEIIELSNIQAREDNRSRITHIDVKNAIRKDAELSELFNGMILGTGVYDKIEDDTQEGGYGKPKKNKSIKKNLEEYISSSGIKRLLYRAGVKTISTDVYKISQMTIYDILSMIIRKSITISEHKRHSTVMYVDGLEALKALNINVISVKGFPGLIKPCKGSMTNMDVVAKRKKTKKGDKVEKLIEKFKKNTCTLIQHEPMKTMIRVIGSDYKSNLRYESAFIWLVQAIVEHIFTNIAVRAYMLAEYSGRTTLKESDFTLVKRINDIKMDVDVPRSDSL